MRNILCLGLITMLALPATAQWKTTVNEDPMSGSVSAYAVSPSAKPLKPIGFPYGGVTGSVAVGCNSNSEWAYVIFSEAPNLVGGDIGDGHTTFDARVKWDDEIESTGFLQEWGSRAIHFRSAGPAISKMQNAGSAMVELAWYGTNKTHFQFSLSGSTSAIDEMRRACK